MELFKIFREIWGGGHGKQGGKSGGLIEECKTISGTKNDVSDCKLSLSLDRKKNQLGEIGKSLTHWAMFPVGVSLAQKLEGGSTLFLCCFSVLLLQMRETLGSPFPRRKPPQACITASHLWQHGWIQSARVLDPCTHLSKANTPHLCGSVCVDSQADPRRRRRLHHESNP